MLFEERMAEIERTYPCLKKLPEVECSICGYFEVYYADSASNILVRTCPTCNYIRVIDLANVPTLSKLS